MASKMKVRDETNMDSLRLYQKAFDHGWIREVVHRKKGQLCDIYYKQGASKLRSSRELMAYLEETECSNLTHENFSWKRQPLGIGEPMEVIRTKSHKRSAETRRSSSSTIGQNKVEQNLVKKATVENETPEQGGEPRSELIENKASSGELVKQLKKKSKKVTIMENKAFISVDVVERKSIVPESDVISDSQISSGIVENQQRKGKKKSKRRRHSPVKLARRPIASADHECDDDSDTRGRPSDSVIDQNKEDEGKPDERMTVENQELESEPHSQLFESDASSDLQRLSIYMVDEIKTILNETVDKSPPVLKREDVTSALDESGANSEAQHTQVDTFPAQEIEEQLAEFEAEKQVPKKKLPQLKANIKSYTKCFVNVEPSDVEEAGCTESQNGNKAGVSDDKEGLSSNKASRKRSIAQSPVTKKRKDTTQLSEEESTMQSQKVTKKLRSSSVPLAPSSVVPSKTGAETKTLNEPEPVNTAFVKPLCLGWKREVVYRKRKTKSHVCDIYYYSPEMKKFRSHKQIERYDLGNKLSVDNFSFVKRPLGLPEGLEIVRRAK